jgi:membrane-associated phospholipid phosphatase
MDWNEHPAWSPGPLPAEPANMPPVKPASSPTFGGLRRTIATAALTVGLLVVGGTAVVLAADPSASPAANASGGTTQPRTHTGSSANCPNMGGSSGSGSSTAPSTNGSTSSPSSSNL